MTGEVDSDLSTAELGQRERPASPGLKTVPIGAAEQLAVFGVFAHRNREDERQEELEQVETAFGRRSQGRQGRFPATFHQFQQRQGRLGGG